MRLGQIIRMGSWGLILLNLIMAMGAVWIFMRMTPAIQRIIERNEHSLEACEEMLASLTLHDHVVGADGSELVARFESALHRAENNITEREEPEALQAIRGAYAGAFSDDPIAGKQTVSAILQLGRINRQAMIDADLRAQHFGRAGAWSIVFMAVSVFLVGMIFNRYLRDAVVAPLDEIERVILAHERGDALQRCFGNAATQEIKRICNGLNNLLDHKK